MKKLGSLQYMIDIVFEYYTCIYIAFEILREYENILSKYYYYKLRLYKELYIVKSMIYSAQYNA